MEYSPNDVQNSQTTYQWKDQETRNTSIPSSWSKGCCGGWKTRSNSRPTLFLSYLSNGEESEKRDHGNEFIGSKNGGKEVWISLKLSKNKKFLRPKLEAAAAAFVGSIRAHPVAVGREILPTWSSGRPPPPWTARVQWWWPESAPTAETRSA